MIAFCKQVLDWPLWEEKFSWHRGGGPPQAQISWAGFNRNRLTCGGRLVRNRLMPQEALLEKAHAE